MINIYTFFIIYRHEHHPQRGRYLIEQDMLQDIELMLQHNINAVRTSHYPNAPRWYELCDEYGIYLIDEANLETQALHDQLSKGEHNSLEFHKCYRSPDQ